MKEFKHTLGLLRADLNFWKKQQKSYKKELETTTPTLKRYVNRGLVKIEARIVELKRAITILDRND